MAILISGFVYRGSERVFDATRARYEWTVRRHSSSPGDDPDRRREAQRSHGSEPGEAIYQACLVRFGPIMMTTMTALMGTLPMRSRDDPDHGLEAQRLHGSEPGETIYQARLVRFRPIMATLMDTLPIALGFGAEGDATAARARRGWGDWRFRNC